MNDKDIRWKQRFQNFEKAVNNLKEATGIISPSDVESAGIIQFFEVAFELAWKTLKDYLNDLGYDIKAPRETIKQAFQDDIIEDGEVWIEMLETRNLVSHTYDEETIESAIENIRSKFYPKLEELRLWLKQK